MCGKDKSKKEVWKQTEVELAQNGNRLPVSWVGSRLGRCNLQLANNKAVATTVPALAQKLKIFINVLKLQPPLPSLIGLSINT